MSRTGQRNMSVRTEDRNEHVRRVIFAVVVVILSLALGLIGYTQYQNYSTMVLDKQKEQLMDISASVSRSMEIYLQGFSNTAHTMVLTDQFQAAEEACQNGDSAPMTRYLSQIYTNRKTEVDRIEFDIAGTCLASVGSGKKSRLFKVMGDDENFDLITIYKSEDGAFTFGIGAKTDQGNWLTMYVNCDYMYSETSEYLQMGENGYVMIKDSNGIILMHQVDAQVGIDVLADRKRQYPDFDFSELEVLIQHQLEGQTDVETYNSYWWAEEKPHKTRKVAAYMPVYLGDDFIITSAVIDYSSVAGEIETGMLRFVGIFFGLMGGAVIFLMFLDHSFRQQQQKEQEIQDLRQQNEDLERQRKQEEMMAHQQRLELIGTMTSGIAHEFNNLLTPIMGYSALILSGMSEDDENYEDMKEIVETSEKAKEIISQINQFSSKGAEQMMEPIHVSAAVKKAIVITEAAKRRNITIHTDVETKNDICIGNPLQIQQMVMNLCNNAIQAMGNDKGMLKITAKAILPTEKVNPFFAGRKNEWFYQIEVQDTGCGMSEETMAQIFTPFFTTKRPGEGTGLGLAVVYRMVEAHKGLICVNSVRGEGTTFRIYIPLVEAPEIEVAK